MFQRLDHLAIVVRDTETSLRLYRDKMGLKVLVSEELPEIGVRLTHLHAGGIQLQLVEPLRNGHPLQAHLEAHGESLHHLCWKVDDVEEVMKTLPGEGFRIRPNEPHPGVEGRVAAFLDPADTNGVLHEITSKRP